MSYSVSTGGAGPGDPAAFSALEVLPQRTRDSVTRLFNESDFIRLSLVGNAGGVRTVLDTVVFATDDWPGVFDTSGRVLLRDKYDGTTAALNYISVEANGIEMAQLSPVNSDIPNSSGLDYAGGFTARVGLVFNGNSDGTGKPCRAKGGRIVDPPSQGVQTPGVGRPDFVVFGENVVMSGVLGEDQLMTAYTQGGHDVSNLETGQVGLYGRYVCAMTKLVSFPNEASVVVTRNRVLATDGREADLHCHVIIDPIERKVYEWNITAGGAATDLLGFTLCCNHGGGVLIAAPASNGSIYALCAKVDSAGPVYSWQDFNPSNAGVATASDRAFIGTASGGGLPADDIIALVPVTNDDARYETLFGCSRSIWSLRGDPRIDGGLALVSNSTGFFGPRAWCFDNKGNLWWLGNGGLHAMPRGSRSYTKTDGHKLPRDLELARLDARQVQLAYRASDNTILIFQTPRVGESLEGTSAEVQVFDIDSGEFTKDTYPPGVGPTAVVEITGRKPEDRDVVLIGHDGRVYRYDDGAFSDNGEPIDALAVFVAGGDAGSVQALCDIGEFESAPGSGPATLSVYTAPTPGEVAAFRLGEYEDGELGDRDEPDLEYDLWTQRAGADRVLINRIGGGHLFAVRQFSSDGTFALERAQGRFTIVSEGGA